MNIWINAFVAVNVLMLRLFFSQTADVDTALNVSQYVKALDVPAFVKALRRLPADYAVERMFMEVCFLAWRLHH